jgi:hypothetical protein
LFYFIKQRWDRDFKSQINYRVDELQAILEAYKDLPIAIVSFDCLFYLVSVIKKAMLIGQPWLH